jgi:hypothetical protein
VVHARPQLSRDPLGGGNDLSILRLTASSFVVILVAIAAFPLWCRWFETIQVYHEKVFASGVPAGFHHWGTIRLPASAREYHSQGNIDTGAGIHRFEFTPTEPCWPGPAYEVDPARFVGRVVGVPFSPMAAWWHPNLTGTLSEDRLAESGLRFFEHTYRLVDDPANSPEQKEWLLEHLDKEVTLSIAVDCARGVAYSW